MKFKIDYSSKLEFAPINPQFLTLANLLTIDFGYFRKSSDIFNSFENNFFSNSKIMRGKISLTKNSNCELFQC